MTRVTATTQPGLESVLQRELRDAGAAEPMPADHGEVTFHVHHPEEARGLIHEVRTLRRLRLPDGTTIPPAGHRSLDHRGYLVHDHGGATRSTVAAAMLRVAGWHAAGPGAVVADPFCGGGTIGVEAAWMRHGVPPTCLRDGAPPQVEAPGPQVVLGDMDPDHSMGARRNAEAAGVRGVVRTYVGDVERLIHEVEAPLACIVTDPPFRSGLVDPGPAEDAVANLLQVAAGTLGPDGVVVLRNPRDQLVRSAAQEASLDVEAVLEVRYGALTVPVWRACR